MSIDNYAMKVEIVVVPYDSGKLRVRMGRGPERLLELGLPDLLRSLGADVAVHHVELRTAAVAFEIRAAFELQCAVAKLVSGARSRDAFALVLSGNCNTAVGTVAGLCGASGATPVVCWFDAHADFNTPETTMGGFLDGMALATVTGRCWRTLSAQVPGFAPVPESSVLMTGVRHVDPQELALLKSSGVRRCDDVGAIASQLSSAVESAAATDIYAHVDLDVLDVSEGRANEYAIGGGLSRSDLLTAVAAIQATGRLNAAAFTAYDPSCDDTGRIGEIALEVAGRLIFAENR